MGALLATGASTAAGAGEKEAAGSGERGGLADEIALFVAVPPTHSAAASLGFVAAATGLAMSLVGLASGGSSTATGAAAAAAGDRDALLALTGDAELAPSAPDLATPGCWEKLISTDLGLASLTGFGLAPFGEGAAAGLRSSSTATAGAAATAGGEERPGPIVGSGHAGGPDKSARKTMAPGEPFVSGESTEGTTLPGDGDGLPGDGLPGDGDGRPRPAAPTSELCPPTSGEASLEGRSDLDLEPAPLRGGRGGAALFRGAAGDSRTTGAGSEPFLAWL